MILKNTGLDLGLETIMSCSDLGLERCRFDYNTGELGDVAVKAIPSQAQDQSLNSDGAKISKSSLPLVPRM